MNLPSFVDVYYDGDDSDIKRVLPHWRFTCDACSENLGDLYYEAAAGYALGHPCCSMVATPKHSLDEAIRRALGRP